MRFWTGVTTLVVIVSTTAAAQERPSPYVAGSVSAANMQSATDIAYAGSFGYRFNPFVSFVVEAAGIPALRESFPNDELIGVTSGSVQVNSSGGGAIGTTTSVLPRHPLSEGDGRILLFTNSVRVDLRMTSSRITPFVVAGGGVANMRRQVAFVSGPEPLSTGEQTSRLGHESTERISFSSTDLALTIGGGVGIQVASAVWLDTELRLFRLVGDSDRNLGRFGVGVRYTF